MYVLPGWFLLRNIVFRGKCKNNSILILIDGTITAPSDYHVIGNLENWLLFKMFMGFQFLVGYLMAKAMACGIVKPVARNALVEQRYVHFLEIFLVISCYESKTQYASSVKISNVKYQNIHGTSATEITVRFDCSEKNACIGIELENVDLTYNNQPANASCNNADGTSFGSIQIASCLGI
ncbi:hypothetical protein GH714_030964 [Hevea brasiliensis]|uniref:Polygalacturonase n=1 Tax=Hevea brasiliensis TaxID=3981 RepID=A0A6A6NJZ0_HEVBR|nr:hypothetical protein GH714_030964 [Hevea brasiliensis]